MIKESKALKPEYKLDKQANEIIIFLSKELKRLRTEKKLTVLTLSELSHVSTGHISDVENGKVNTVGLRIIIKMCQAMNEDFIDVLTFAHTEYQKLNHQN